MRIFVPLALLFTGFGHAPTASAAPVWVGDIESADLSQWDYLLNPEVNGMTYAQATTEMAVQGRYAARVELHNDAVWPNGLKRVELQHSPEAGRTAEGATTYFAWSFYLPEVLATDPTTQIGYWESEQSYQQMMAFQVSGESLSFSTRRPNNVVQWQQDGVLTAGEWHRIAMRVAWSKDVNLGEVDVWFDGEQVVVAAAAQTLADDNPHFTHVGLLRGQVEFDEVVVIFIDDAVEGDNLEDVHPDLMPPGGTTSGGEDTGATGEDTGTEPGETSAGDSMTTAATTVGTTDPDGTGPTTATTAGDAGTGESTSNGAGGDDDSSGCGCASDPRGGAWGLGLLLLARCRRRRGAI